MTRPKKGFESLTIRLSPELRAQVQQMARDFELDQSELGREAIRQYIGRLKLQEKRKRTKR